MTTTTAALADQYRRAAAADRAHGTAATKADLDAAHAALADHDELRTHLAREDEAYRAAAAHPISQRGRGVHTEALTAAYDAIADLIG